MKRMVSLLSVALLLVFISGCGTRLSRIKSLNNGTSSTSKTTDTSHSASKTIQTSDSSASTGSTNDDQNAGSQSSDKTSDSSAGKGSTNGDQNAESQSSDKASDSSASTGNTNGDQSAGSQSSDASVGSTHHASVHISNIAEAISYLRHQLKMEHNNDISFGEMDGLATDKRGAYYTIKLVDVSVRGQGGSGTIGRYKVYQNGAYVLINPNVKSLIN